MGKETKAEYRELKKEYRLIKTQYSEEKRAIKDKARRAREELRDEYKIRRFSLKKPLKADKYRLRVERKRENRALNEPPRRKLIEEIGNAVTHGVGAAIALVCLFLMLHKAKTGVALTAAAVYGTCFVLQMLFSCLYHSFASGTTVKRVFRRFDYSTIYLQIGGTFAPLYLIYMNGSMWGSPWGYVFFAVQWAFIAVGVTFVSVFGPGRIKWLHFTLYFVLGWSGVLFIPYFLSNDPALFFFILGGGLIYTLGMIPFSALKKKESAHFIWHFFVLFGAIVQWTGIYLYVF
ncbi:MAG: hemolysin III family protein [Clostridia bacterium]|nr:hemolysin III family protein [Clostridia bacterium]